MSVYDDLNEWKLDAADYEEEALSEAERSEWAQRIGSRLTGSSQSTQRARQPGRNRKAKGLMSAAAVLLLAGAAWTYSPQALAEMPWVAGLIENFGSTSGGEAADYSSYKTQIGQTAENEYGKLTLNEVLFDTDRLLISATFEPTGQADFDYRTFLSAAVAIDGRDDLQLTTGTQSIEEKDGTYTIYGEVNLSELPNDGPMNLSIVYDEIRHGQTWLSDSSIIEPKRPWTFDIQASAGELVADTQTIELERSMKLATGEEIRVEKALVSPVSTLLYYRVLNESEFANPETPRMTAFLLQDEHGTEIPFIEAGSREASGRSGEGWHYARYASIDPAAHAYTLTPYQHFDGEPHAVGESFALDK